MIFDTLRVFADGMFHYVPLPDWYTEACRLCDEEHIDWHRAFDRVLDCAVINLTEEDMNGGWIEIRFWPGRMAGTLLLIETPLGLIEQVLVPKPKDWLPFLTTHLARLIAASTQSAIV